MSTTLSSDEIESLAVARLAPRLRNNVITYDGDYVMISDASCGQFMADLAEETVKVLGSWRSEYRDCDKFARLLQALAIADHADSWIADGRTPNGGLAIGTLSYVQDSGGNHAINLIYTKVIGKSQINLRTYEPQTGEELFLSPSEKASCFKLVI